MDKCKFLIFSCLLSFNMLAQAEPEHPARYELCIPKDTLSSQEFLEQVQAQTFSPLEGAYLNKGFESRSIWIRITPVQGRNFSSYNLLEIRYPLLDHVEIFGKVKGHWISLQSGDHFPLSKRLIPNRNPVFDLSTTRLAEAEELYLHVSTSGSVQLPFKWWESRFAYERQTLTEYLFLGGYYGIIIALLIYNLVLFGFLRDLTYLFYVLYSASYVVFQASLNGLIYQHTDIPNDTIERWTIGVAGMLGFFFMAKFTQKFLNTKIHSPRLDFVISTLSHLTLAGAILATFAPPSIMIRAVVIGSFFIVGIIIAAASIVAWRGYRPAYCFAIAWSIFLGGTLLMSLKNAGLAPPNWFFTYSQQVGSAVEMVLLSLGLGYRIRIAEKARQAVEQTMQNYRIRTARAEAVARTAQMLAHDVRRPFSKLITGLSWLKALAQNTPHLREPLARLSSQVESDLGFVTHMMQDILDLNRNMARSMQKNQALNLLTQTIHSLKQARDLPNLNIEVSCSPYISVLADSAQIERVLANIIDNAIDASGIDARFQIRVNDDGSVVTFSIFNPHSFIPPEDLEMVFEAFFTKGKSQGTGLGLAIAAKIVADHGGKIWCQSQENYGTTVSFSLQRYALMTTKNEASDKRLRTPPAQIHSALTL